MSYETDFYAWTQEQAAALRAGRLGEIDLAHLAVEIEEMGGGTLDALENNLSRVIEHLLKLDYSPAGDPRRGWILSIVEHRDRVATTIRRSGTLARRLPELLPEAWNRARKRAIKGLELDGVDTAAIPRDCPYTLARILDEDWYPRT